MTRQLDLKAELKETARRDALVRALEFGIVGALESQGIQLIGLALRYSDFDCLLTIKADIEGVRSICFVGSDTIMNCFLKAEATALRYELKWRADKYHKTES